MNEWDTRLIFLCANVSKFKATNSTDVSTRYSRSGTRGRFLFNNGFHLSRLANGTPWCARLKWLLLNRQYGQNFPPLLLSRLFPLHLLNMFRFGIFVPPAFHVVTYKLSGSGARNSSKHRRLYRDVSVNSRDNFSRIDGMNCASLLLLSDDADGSSCLTFGTPWFVGWKCPLSAPQ